MMRITRFVEGLGIALVALAGCSGGTIAPGEGRATASAAATPRTAKVAAPAPTGTTPFIEFESGPVRPIALSADGSRLFVTNIPDNRLEIFDVDRAGLHHAASVPVGLEPVTVAVRNDCEVWVVNHLSDSVSIVDVGRSPPRVTRTLLVGDEPRDLVFAGPGRGRAFITTAHRGQQRTDGSIAGRPGAGDPQLTTAGVARADVWVFDADHLGDGVGGAPLSIVSLFGDTPRALAASADGRTVYAAIFKSGNQTTTVSSGAVCIGFDDTPCEIEGVQYPGGVAGPATNHEGAPAPHVGIIVKHDAKSGHWLDTKGRIWDAAVRFRLPDQDVFAIDARSLVPTRAFAHVGTTLFNMVANPRTNALYVSNSESRNDARFEGPGQFGGSTVQGHLAESRITVITDAGASGQVRPRHLNKHIDYSVRPAPVGVAAASLSTPLDLAITRDGGTLYVAAFGSSKVGVIGTGALEADALDPRVDSAGYIAVSGGGPSGLALDEQHHRLYVYTRFDDGISVVDTQSRRERSHVRLFNPEPPRVVAGRRLLYDAAGTSSNGEASCASCHIFGDNDELAWDLGNPDDGVSNNPIPILLAAGIPTQSPPINGTGNGSDFHPMKGPMTTQTLRGMVNSGAMHWRGDRANGHYGSDTRTAAPFDSDLAFRNFIVAFPGLVGRADAISDDEMTQFAAFALALTLPPNPVRNLDNSLTPSQLRGKTFYVGCDGVDSITGAAMPADCMEHPPTGAHGHFSDGAPFPGGNGFTCAGCHTLDPQNGFFGTSGLASFEALPQIFKIPHLRNIYTKAGMFGMPSIAFIEPGNNDDLGDQIRGFGFLHDGSVDTPFRFVSARVFNSAGGRVGFSGADPEAQRRDVEQWLLAFDSDLAPVVGQQVTMSRANAMAATARLELLRARAAAPFASQIVGVGVSECDLVATAVVHGVAMSWLYRPASATWEPDDGGPALPAVALRTLATTGDNAVTFTAVPPGSGVRVALDRDSDGVVNRRDPSPDDPSCS